MLVSGRVAFRFQIDILQKTNISPSFFGSKKGRWWISSSMGVRYGPISLWDPENNLIGKENHLNQTASFLGYQQLVFKKREIYIYTLKQTTELDDSQLPNKFWPWDFSMELWKIDGDRHSQVRWRFGYRANDKPRLMGVAFLHGSFPGGIHPRKLTWPLKRDYFNRQYIFQPMIFRGHVSFPASICSGWKHFWLRGPGNRVTCLYIGAGDGARSEARKKTDGMCGTARWLDSLRCLELRIKCWKYGPWWIYLTCIYNWAVLSDEQMCNGYPFSRRNDEHMSNKVGVEHQPDKIHIYHIYIYIHIWYLIYPKFTIYSISTRPSWVPLILSFSNVRVLKPDHFGWSSPRK